MASRHKPDPRPDCVVILPCSKRKPYSLSRSHRLFEAAIAPHRRRASIDEVVLTSPLGAVPRALEGVPPASCYDIPVTGIWSHEEIETVSRSLLAFLRTYGEDPLTIIAHVSGGYREACRRTDAHLGWPFRIFDGESTTTQEGLRFLSDSLGALTGTPRPRDPLRTARQILSYQYGPEIAACMVAPPARIRGKRMAEMIVAGEKGIARRNPQTGFFTPQIGGAMILAERSSYCVDLDFKPRTKVVYCPGVVSADPDIRPGDEVVLRRDGDPVAEGRSVLAGREMVRADRGKAVLLREIFT